MNNWEPIETAPHDRAILLYRPNAGPCQVAVGYWEGQKLKMDPKPYWAIALANYNQVRYARAYLPTHWMDLPKPPTP